MSKVADMFVVALLTIIGVLVFPLGIRMVRDNQVGVVMRKVGRRAWGS